MVGRQQPRNIVLVFFVGVFVNFFIRFAVPYVESRVTTRGNRVSRCWFILSVVVDEGSLDKFGRLATIWPSIFQGIHSRSRLAGRLYPPIVCHSGSLQQSDAWWWNHTIPASLLVSPSNQQTWYLLCRMNGSLASKRKGFDYLSHFTAGKWYRIKIHFIFSEINLRTTRIND